MSTLTHQTVTVQMPDAKFIPDPQTIRRTANAGYMRDTVANKLVFFSAHLLHVICQSISEDDEDAESTSSTS